MSISQKTRISYYDNLRFFLILTVVAGHFINLLTSQSTMARILFIWIWSFHMPLFIFISGMFHKSERILPKILKFLLIGYLLEIFMLISNIVMRGGTPTLSFYGGDGIWWYVFVLAVYTGLSYLLRKMDKRFILVFSVILGLFSGYDPTLGDAFFASRIIVYYPFFVLGEMVSPNKPLIILRKKWVRLLGVLVLVLWAALCVLKLDDIYSLRPLFTGRNSFGNRYGSWGCLYRGLCYIIELITGFGVICLIPERELPVLTYLGSHTLQIYFWHNIVREVLRNLPMYAVLTASPSGKIIWVLIGVVCTFVLGLKIFEFPTSQIVRASRYAENPADKADG